MSRTTKIEYDIEGIPGKAPSIDDAPSLEEGVRSASGIDQETNLSTIAPSAEAIQQASKAAKVTMMSNGGSLNAPPLDEIRDIENLKNGSHDYTLHSRTNRADEYVFSSGDKVYFARVVNGKQPVQGELKGMSAQELANFVTRIETDPAAKVEEVETMIANAKFEADHGLAATTAKPAKPKTM